MLVKWDPFAELDRTLNWWGGRPYTRPLWDDRNWESEYWTPAANVYEDKDHVYYEVLLPGIDLQDVNISVNEQTLEIHGERKAEEEKQSERYHLQEVRYGKFLRRFAVPAEVDADQAKATYEKGMLKIVLPKSDKAKPRQIPIEVQEG